eukprot:361921-Chlamydomonas_euryale.AAC.7
MKRAMCTCTCAITRIVIDKCRGNGWKLRGGKMGWPTVELVVTPHKQVRDVRYELRCPARSCLINLLTFPVPYPPVHPCRAAVLEHVQRPLGWLATVTWEHGRPAGGACQVVEKMQFPFPYSPETVFPILKL